MALIYTPDKIGRVALLERPFDAMERASRKSVLEMLNFKVFPYSLRIFFLFGLPFI